MELAYIEPFINATVGVFREMFAEEPVFLNPYLVSDDKSPEWDISGIIGIGGDSKGVVVVSLASELAASLTSRLVGRPVGLGDPDIVDAVGEVVNIIAGNAKKGLEQYRLSISLPSIVRGQNHNLSWPTNVPIIGIPFKLSTGKFHLAVGLENIIKA